MTANENSSSLVPVLFLTFNRPESTKRVFSAIRAAKPFKLYIASDGPRQQRANEKKTVIQIRDFLSRNIDWDCEPKFLFRDTNSGCKIAVSDAISWFFEHEEMGIILEDDCLPSSSFFPFCNELLQKHKNNDEILHIGGTNPIESPKRLESYYYSKYNRIWGWATWRRAWNLYDGDLKNWPKLKKTKQHYKLFKNKEEAAHWEKAWDNVYQKKIDTWDYQWFFNRVTNGLAIISSTNLVTNIGFNEDATHTTQKNDLVSDLPRYEIEFPLTHPKETVVDEELDDIWSNHIVASKTTGIKTRIKNRIKSLLR